MANKTMTDIFSKKQRSKIMRAVKPKGNGTTEVRLIEIFKSHHITSWRRNYKLVGHPDFVFPGKRIVIFADGCFWHGHNCRNLSPSDNAGYWKKKIEKNKARDKSVTKELIHKGWRVIRIWECEIKEVEVHKLLAKGLLNTKSVHTTKTS
jgi:DNA mismatch endonuclease, patch repair protein